MDPNYLNKEVTKEDNNAKKLSNCEGQSKPEIVEKEPQPNSSSTIAGRKRGYCVAFGTTPNPGFAYVEDSEDYEEYMDILPSSSNEEMPKSRQSLKRAYPSSSSSSDSGSSSGEEDWTLEKELLKLTLTLSKQIREWK